MYHIILSCVILYCHMSYYTVMSHVIHTVMCHVTLIAMCHLFLSCVMWYVICHASLCYLVLSRPPWPPAGRSSAGCHCRHHFPSPETDPEDALHCNLSLCSVATHPGPEPAPAYHGGLPHLPNLYSIIQYSTLQYITVHLPHLLCTVPPRQLDWLHRGGEGQVGGQSEERTKYCYISINRYIDI